jgi:hypothetical protein
MTAAVAQRVLWPEADEISQLGFALLAGMAGAIIATFCDKPTEPEVLREFYMKTRPFGFWGHLKKKLPLEEQQKVTREHVSDLTAVPFALLWQVSLFLAPMLFVIHSWKAFGGTVALFLIGGGGLYWFWYRRLPKENYYD